MNDVARAPGDDRGRPRTRRLERSKTILKSPCFASMLREAADVTAFVTTSTS
jgi:hypothetical protein